MKGKRLLATILVFCLCLCACSGREVSTSGSASEQISSESSSSQAVELLEEPDSAPSDAFYPAAAAYLEYDGSAIRGLHSWNEDGTLTFQHENKLTTLSVDNQVIETITLPLEYLSEDGGYDLTWSESRILAIDRQTEESWNQYGVVYFTDDGGVHFANLTLFDRQGNLIRQYHQGEVNGYDEDGNYVYYLPCPEGTEILSVYYLADGNHTYWLDDETVILECHSRIVLYDFAADAGRVLDDMSELVDYHGRFGVYYGSDSSLCGVLDGSFYYLARHSDQKSYTLWCADKNGSEELFDGKEFWYLKVARQSLLLCDYVDPTNGETDDRVYIADPDDGLVLKEILIGDPTIPFFDNGVIGFYSGNYWEEDGAILYAYDYHRGELYTHSLGRPVQINEAIAKMMDGSLRYYYTLFEDGEATDWVYDTATGTTTELTGYGLGNLRAISFSPDGEHYIEYDPESEQPRLRVSRWEY